MDIWWLSRASAKSSVQDLPDEQVPPKYKFPPSNPPSLCCKLPLVLGMCGTVDRQWVQKFWRTCPAGPVRNPCRNAGETVTCVSKCMRSLDPGRFE